MITKSSKNYGQITGHYLNNSSEANLFPVMYDTANNEYFMNIFRAYIVNDNVQNNILFYLTHEVSDTDWLDTISNTYYGTPTLWWVIALMNNFTNPFEDLVPGTNLRILKSDYIYQLLNEINMVASL
jgi:hypothetical protein